MNINNINSKTSTFVKGKIEFGKLKIKMYNKNGQSHTIKGDAENPDTWRRLIKMASDIFNIKIFKILLENVNIDKENGDIWW